MSAIVLLSGGVDSMVVGAMARQEHRNTTAVTFDYGQPHFLEIESARRIALQLGMRWVELKLPHIAASNGTTQYYPQRNLIFLAHAISMAESRKGGVIYYAPTREDQEDYPDCRPEFLDALQYLLPEGVKVKAPSIASSKAELVQIAVEWSLPIGLTWTCYHPVAANIQRVACGRCGACVKRIESFKGHEDPMRYER